MAYLTVYGNLAMILGNSIFYLLKGMRHSGTETLGTTDLLHTEYLVTDRIPDSEEQRPTNDAVSQDSHALFRAL